MNTEQTIRNLLEEKGFEPTSKDQKLKDDLGMDSLDLVELVIEMEKEFNIDLGFDFEDKINKMTIQDLVIEIEKLKGV